MTTTDLAIRFLVAGGFEVPCDADVAAVNRAAAINLPTLGSMASLFRVRGGDGVGSVAFVGSYRIEALEGDRLRVVQDDVKRRLDPTAHHDVLETILGLETALTLLSRDRDGLKERLLARAETDTLCAQALARIDELEGLILSRVENR